MATYKDGDLNGRLGNHVHYRLNGKTVVRKRGINDKPPSLAQLAVRRKLSLLSEFFKLAMGFLNVGFAAEAGKANLHPQQLATKCNFHKAMKGVYPEIVIDYSRIQLSMGPLMPPLEPKLSLESEGLRLSWLVAGLDYQNRYDRLMLLIYFPDHAEAICFLNAAQRETGTEFVRLEPEMLSRKLLVYVAFMAEDKSLVSDSVCLIDGYLIDS